MPDIRVDVAVQRSTAVLLLDYRVTGSVDALLLPSPAPPARADGLWQHSCFEAFLREVGAGGYVELNLSPSGEWAAYRFAGYRDGMRVANEIDLPRMEMRTTEESCELRAVIDLSRVAAVPAEKPWRIGLSAVIETKDGDKSWWALAHPEGDPDFHHQDCFALELPPPIQP